MTFPVSVELVGVEVTHQLETMLGLRRYGYLCPDCGLREVSLQKRGAPDDRKPCACGETMYRIRHFTIDREGAKRARTVREGIRRGVLYRCNCRCYVPDERR